LLGGGGGICADTGFLFTVKNFEAWESGTKLDSVCVKSQNKKRVDKMTEKKEVSRVKITTEAIKESYGKISKFYATLEGIAEKGLRKKGLKLLAIQEGELVLEIGFGTGFTLCELAKSVGETGKAYGIDITPQMAEITRKRLEKKALIDRAEIYEEDARNMPFDDNLFDAVYTASTLELFDTPEIAKVLKEIKRVLKPEGRLCVVSISKEGHENSFFLGFYKCLHKIIPKFFNCRPIYLEDSIRETGYKIVKTEEFMLARLMPEKIVVAEPQKAGLR